MRRISAFYVGRTWAGRTTSMESVLKQCGHPPLPYFDLIQCVIGGLHLPHSDVEATIRLSTRRHMHRPVPPLQQPLLDAEFDFMRTASGFVFVLDSSRLYRPHALESLQLLRDDMLAMGRELEHTPIVFQANKRDQDDAMSMEEIESLYRTDWCRHVESIATEDVGTLLSLHALCNMLTSPRSPPAGLT